MADRIVSVKLVADVNEYTSQMAKAAAATKGLGSTAESSARTTKTSMDASSRSAAQMGDKVADSNKKIGLSADEAARQIAAVRAELVELGRSNTGAGVKVDTIEARTNLEKLRQKLQEIDAAEPDARVKAETGAAEAQLRAIQSQLNRIDGQTVNAKVDVDDHGSTAKAVSGMSTLISTAIAVSPALIGIGAAAVAGLGAIAPLAASAGAGLGVLALGFHGVGDAVKLVEQRHDAAAAEAAKSATSQAASARQVQSAQAALANAQANAADGAISASSRVAKADQNLARARVDAADGVAQARSRATSDIDAAIKQQESAERELTTAQKGQKQAQLDLTQARKDAQQQLEDLTASVQENALSQRQSVLDVADARKKLDAVLNDPTASQAQREQAKIDYEEAVLRQQELATQGKRLADQQADANKKGVEGSDQVVKAQDRVVSANEAVATATQNVGDAAAKVDKARQDGAAEVARAQREGAQKIADAQAQVADATRAQAEQQRQAAYSIQQAQAAVQAAMASTADSSTSSLGQIDAKLGAVGASTLAFAQYVDGKLKPAFKRLQETAANGVLPGVQSGLDSLLRQEPQITAFVDTFAKAIGGLAGDSLRRLSDPQWGKFFNMLQSQGVPQLEAMWHSGDNLAEAFGSLMTAFAPLATDMAKGIEDLTQDFANWSAGLSQSQGFHDFEAYVRENWPKIQEIIGNVAQVIGKVIEAGAPIGAAILTGFQALSDVLSMLPVGVVEALLAAFLGYKAVQSVVGIIDGVSMSFANLGDKLTGVDTSATRAKGSLAQLKSVGGDALATLGAAAAIAGIEKIAGDISQVQHAGDDAKDTVNNLKTAIQNADGANGRFQATSAALDALKQKAADAQKIVDDYNNQNWFQKYIWHNPFGDTSDQIEAKKAAGVYGAAIDELQGKQGNLQGATQTATDALGRQSTGLADFTNAASGQLSTYQTLLSDKQTAEQDSAQATADSTKSSTDSWKDYVANVSVSLDELAAKLEEEHQNHERWRDNVVTVTGRGGAEVGQILTDMGDKGADIAAKMATATDAEFQRMKDAMIANARDGGQGSKDEMKTAMDVMAAITTAGAGATAQGIAQQLGLGVGQVAEIAKQYGSTLADGINPVLIALQKPIVVTAEMRATNPYYKNRADGGVIDYYANGGVTERHVAEIAPAGDWRVWAEPETGGEAYIPLAPGKRARSMNIWRETGKRLGAPEAQHFAFGGISDIPRPPSVPANPPVSSAAEAAMGKLYDEASAFIGSQFAEPAATGPAGAGVQRWAPLVLQALAMDKQPASLLNTVLRRMNQESGGNPTIVNRWDSNWLRGTPSVGLMQVIGPTYRAHRDPRRDVGPYVYGTSVDGLSNLLASFDYAIDRYGSLSSAFNRAGGYANGGTTPANEPFWVGERGPELMWSSREQYVSTAAQSREFSGGVGGRASGASVKVAPPQVTVHFHVDGEEFRGMTRTEVDGALAEIRQNLVYA